MYFKVKGFLIEKIQEYLDTRYSDNARVVLKRHTEKCSCDSKDIKDNKSTGSTYLIDLHLEYPKDREHGHFATTIPFSLAKIVKKSPKLIAEDMADFFLCDIHAYSQPPLYPPATTKDIFSNVAHANGYVNFTINPYFIQKEMDFILGHGFVFSNKRDDKYSAISLPEYRPKRILLEYVSANPTGPLHIGHARGAIFGSTLQRLARLLGHDMQGEYYVNDAGSQIDTLAISIYLSVAKTNNIAVSHSYEHSEIYAGEYISDIALKAVSYFGLNFFHNIDTLSLQKLGAFAKDLMLQEIKDNLAMLDIVFDSFVSEKILYKQWDSTLGSLKIHNALQEKDGAIWLKSTLKGDEKDRVLVRENGTPTYMAGDIIYHEDKFKRAFDHYINIWGADHHGYIARIKASMDFLGFDPSRLEVLLSQMVSLLKNGQPYKMSKRAGTFILLKDIVAEIGASNLKFMVLMKSLDMPLEFDIDTIDKEDSRNPIFYINYANARIYTLIDKSSVSMDDIQSHNIPIANLQIDTPVIKDALDMAMQCFELSYILIQAYDSRELHKVCDYLKSLAKSLHTFYTKHKILHTTYEKDILKFLLLVSKTLTLGFRILGIEIKTKM